MEKYAESPSDRVVSRGFSVRQLGIVCGHFLCPKDQEVLYASILFEN